MSPAGRRPLWLASAAFVAVLALAVFREALLLGRILFASDANVGYLQREASRLPAAFFGYWDSSPLLGPEGTTPVGSGNLLLWCLGATVYNNWVYAIHLGLASLFLLGYLRQFGVGWAGSLLGAVSAFWLGSNLTLLYAGHIGKFEVLLFAAAFLWLFERALRSKAWGWAVLSGGALGGMFPDQPDLALFFGLTLGAYALLRCGLVFRTDFAAWAVRLVPTVAVALLIAGPGVLRIYAANVLGTQPQPQAEESPEAKWEFATQWSLPPDEWVDFVAPGYTGWRSGEPAGPYWGRTGRSAGWERTRQGFMNFRLESLYVGAMPIAFALLAVAAAVGMRNAERGTQNAELETGKVSARGPRSELCVPRSAFPSPAWRGEILFWAGVALVTLLLSFGKYFPLYALFYRLPAVGSIRNPNKFIQIFQLAVGILAAFGLDAAVGRHPSPAANGEAAVR